MATIKAYAKGKLYTVQVDPWVKKALKGKAVSLNNAGYPQVSTKKGTVSLHRMVVGFNPEGYETDHINGIKTDARLSNLRFVTKSVNMRHAHSPIKGWIDLAKNYAEKPPKARRTPFPANQRVAKGIYTTGYGRYQVIITNNGNTKQYGSYPCVDSAYQVWVETQIKLGRYV